MTGLSWTEHSSYDSFCSALEISNSEFDEEDQQYIFPVIDAFVAKRKI
jgi:hypothetical protein